MTRPATDTPTIVALEPINSERPSPGYLGPKGTVPYARHGFIRFQEGPVLEEGVNGTSMEVVLKVIIERLEGYQRGPFPCVENADALEHLKRALARLDDRTLARRTQGVEGQNVAHQSMKTSE